MEFLSHFGLFLLEVITIVLAILITVVGIMFLTSKGKSKEKIIIKKLNNHYEELADELKQEILTKKDYKHWHKEQKQKIKSAEKEKRKNLYLIRFHGDMKATEVQSLREKVTALLTIATANDEVLVTVDSGGGIVHAYGLCASQLDRIKQAKIPLTVAVDKVAASGGYLMACVADKIIAAPFAILGSIGVVAQIPNFHRLLEKNYIDFEQITAGEFKRTLTLFGENTEKARQKVHEDVEDIQVIFKDFISRHRPQVEIDRVATGEHWLATRAFDLKLVDTLVTSDDYLMKAAQHVNVYEIDYHLKKPITQKLAANAKIILEKFGVLPTQASDNYYC